MQVTLLCGIHKNCLLHMCDRLPAARYSVLHAPEQMDAVDERQ